MRKAFYFLISPMLLIIGGCEDGPVQTYEPAPPNAGAVWNIGGPDAAVTPGTQQFDAGYPSTGKTQICSTDLKRQRWAWMLEQPIKPPRFYAGIDMAKNDQWDGLTIEDAEKAPDDPNKPSGGLCQSVPYGFIGGCPSGYGACNENYWGNNGEVQFSWNVATHIVDQMVLSLGYTGGIETGPYPDHNGDTHSYTIRIGDVVRRDGVTFEIDWNGDPAPQITDIFNATMKTFGTAAGVPFDSADCVDDAKCSTGFTCQCEKDTADPTKCASGKTGNCGSSNCQADGNCLVYNDGVNTILGFRPLVIYIEGTAGVPQPALSTPIVIYNFFSKWEPFSNLPQVIKIDAEGPVATGMPIGAADPNTVCTQKIGQSFDDFRKNCVQVHGDAADPNGVDSVNYNKILHGLTHDFEHWTANVMGVNQNFTSDKVANDQTLVVLDQDTPQPEDVAQDWTFDVRARGHVENDYGQYAGKEKLDLRGSALVYTEWARLMLEDIGKMLGKPPKRLGDPDCVGFDPVTGNPNYQKKPGGPGIDKGCSGIEGLIIPSVGRGDFTADPSCPDPTTCLDPGANWDVPGFYGVSILKPGGITAALCIDPGTFGDCTYQSNFSHVYNALLHVTRVMGDGDINVLPPELRDRRYYYKWFGVAFVKYLKAYGSANATKRLNWPDKGGLGPTDIKNQFIDQESLFFDFQFSGGGETFDKFEYVDREFIGQGSGGKYNFIPWDFVYGCDIKGGNQRYDDWYRRMDCEEMAMHAAMLSDKTHTPGQENTINITNVFGSVVLGGIPEAGISGLYPSYECAIGQGGDPAPCQTNTCNTACTAAGYAPGTCLSDCECAPAANCDDTACKTGCTSAGYGGGACSSDTTPICICDPNTGSGCPNPPLDATAMTSCASAKCAATQNCVGAKTYETGTGLFCGDPCDYVKFPKTGCQKPSQTCVLDSVIDGVTSACLEMMMDLNGANAPTPHPVLWYYPGAWGRTPFSRGHSPITLKQADKHPGIGAAMITIPNFKGGPYQGSPVAANTSGTGDICPTGWTQSDNGIWCNAPLSDGTGWAAPSFTPLVPWLEVQPGVGFTIPIDGQHDQAITSGQIDFEGVLETYLFDYVPYVDPAKSGCVSDYKCNKGFKCNPKSSACETDDDTIQIVGVEAKDFLGEVFMCVDPATQDVLHVRMYDSALSVIDWLAKHPGDSYNLSAQSSCQILVRYSPYDNFPDFITSKTNGIKLSISNGQGLGRIVDIVAFDTSLIQAL